MEGWIKIHRKILDHWVASNKCGLGAWLIMLVSASYVTTKIALSGRTVEIKKGQLLGDYQGFADMLGYDTQEAVCAFLDQLENDNMITITPIGNNILITITNFAKYQVEQPASGSNISYISIIQEEEKKRKWDGDILPVIDIWLKYKAERRQKYKPIGLRGFISELHKLSNGSVALAQEIVDSSIAKNYSGVFPVHIYGANQPNKPDTSFDQYQYFKEQTKRQ